MSDYSKATDFAAKDALTTGDPDKVVVGTEIDDEFNAISVAVATKYDSTDLASQGEAEAGTNNTKLVTPLRVAQAITQLAPDAYDESSVAITGGAIDGTTVGATTAASGKFTTLQATGKLTVGAEIVETVYAVSGTTPALDPANGTIQTWTLTGNSTPTSNLATGESIVLKILDGTSYTITWPTMEWIGGSAPTLDASDDNWIVLWNVGGSLYGSFVGVSS